MFLYPIKLLDNGGGLQKTDEITLKLRTFDTPGKRILKLLKFMLGKENCVTRLNVKAVKDEFFPSQIFCPYFTAWTRKTHQHLNLN